MALRTITVGDIQRAVAGIPADQPFLIIGGDGLAYTVDGLDPLTVTDDATGQQILTLLFERGSVCFGFDAETGTKIDSREGVEEP